MNTFYNPLPSIMDDRDKPPDLSYKIKVLLFFFLVSGTLFATILFSLFIVQRNENEKESLYAFINPQKEELVLEENAFIQEELILLNGNTLLANSNVSNSANIVKKMPVIVTAYSSTPWETWGNPFVTAAGTWVKDGIIANNYLPFGTKVRIPEIYGDKIFIVEDRMHSRKGYYHVDIWFSSYYEAKEFGVKKTYIEILEG